MLWSKKYNISLWNIEEYMYKLQIEAAKVQYVSKCTFHPYTLQVHQDSGKNKR